MSIKSFIIFISGILVNNLYYQIFRICPFLGGIKQVETAMGMGTAVTFVMTLASIITYFVQIFI